MPFGTSSPIAPNGAYGRVFNAKARNNGVSQYDLSADGAALMRPGNGSIVYANSVSIGSPSVNITTAGPVAGGRDQAAAFPNDSQVHFYLISDGLTISGIASLSGPVDTTSGATVDDGIGVTLRGPTMPTGFLFWAYYGCVPMTGANLHAGQFCGAWFHFQAALALLTNGNSTAGAAFNCTPSMPNASQVLLNLKARLATSVLGAAESEARLNVSYNNGGTLREIRSLMPIIVPLASGANAETKQIIVDLQNLSGANAFTYIWQNEVNPANINTREFSVDLVAFHNRWME